jgi:hypothetical protein
MTKKQAAALKPGDKIKTKYGEVLTVKYVCPYWRGLLTSAERERINPYGYYFNVEEEKDYYDHRYVQLV